MASGLRVELGGHVAVVTLPKAPLAEKLLGICDRLGQDDDVWVVVVTGRRGAFGSAEDPNPGVPPSPLRMAGGVAALAKPVIAAIEGDAIDHGLELALACDVRIATRGARLGLTQVTRGELPLDGGTQRLPRLVGRGRALEMLLTGRLVDAHEALEIGLVNEVVPGTRVLPRAKEVASLIAAHGPIAARYLKEAVLSGADLTLEQGLRLEADLSVILQSTADRAEGIRSFLERRRPTYRGQ